MLAPAGSNGPPQGMAGPCSQVLLVCREGTCTADIAATINIIQTVAGPLQRTELQSSNSVWKCVLLLLVLLFFFYLSDVYRMTVFTRFFYTFSILITQWWISVKTGQNIPTPPETTILTLSHNIKNIFLNMSWKAHKVLI